MKTKLGEMTPETVRQAFLNTGIKPNPLDYEACGIGAFITANSGHKVSGLTLQEINQVLGITSDQRDAFSRGFFGREITDENIYKGCEDEHRLGYACHQAVIDLINNDDDTSVVTEW